jgi:hypothetical protein
MDESGLALILGVIFTVWIIEGIALIWVGFAYQSEGSVRIVLIVLGTGIIMAITSRMYSHWKLERRKRGV